MRRMYYTRDPKTSRNGRVLTIEGLDPELFEQGSEECGTVTSKNNTVSKNSNNSNNDNENAIVTGIDNLNIGTTIAPTIPAPAPAPTPATVTPTVTRTGRIVRPAPRLTSSTLGELSEETDEDEMNAVDIEDLLLESTYNLGEDELCLLNVESVTECPSMQEEEYILSMIDKNNNFDEVHQAFGYINEKKEYVGGCCFETERC